MRGLVLGVVLGLALVACSGAERTRANRANAALVFLEGGVRDAEVWVDGRYIAPIAALRGGLRIDAGEHRVEIRHKRFYSFYAEFTVAAKQRKRIDVELAERLD